MRTQMRTPLLTRMHVERFWRVGRGGVAGGSHHLGAWKNVASVLRKMGKLEVSQ